jgi:hypothetical protein
MKTIRLHWPCLGWRLLALMMITLIAHGCASGPTIVGTWQAVEGNATVSFADNGVFHAVDNQGMPVSGIYRLKGADGIQFEIRHGGEETETIDAKINRAGEQITLTFPGENAVETYKRIP